MITNEEKIIKTSMDIKRAKNTIDLLKISGKPFSVIMTNYTITIKGLINIAFMKEEKSLQFFSLFNELKREVDLFLNNYKLPVINEKHYYDISDHKDFIASEVFNIDLSSAYLHVLKNEGIISNQLFDKLNVLPKMDRLGIVGMLASSKREFEFSEKGIIYNSIVHENREQRNVFFYCVHLTYLIMNSLKLRIGKDYIFSWVDGIYFFNKENIVKAADYLNKTGYPFKVDTLNNFEYYLNGDAIEIDFLKDNEKKQFVIPLKKNNFAENIYNYLQSLK